MTSKIQVEKICNCRIMFQNGILRLEEKILKMRKQKKYKLICHHQLENLALKLLKIASMKENPIKLMRAKIGEVQTFLEIPLLIFEIEFIDMIKFLTMSISNDIWPKLP